MGRLHAWLFALFIVIYVIVAVLAFARPWVPELASDRSSIDRAMKITLWVTGIAFVTTHLLLAYFSWRYRAREGTRASYWHENVKLELTWTILTAVILSGLVLNALRIWARIYTPPPKDAITVEVTGQQFAWNIRYPGADGIFGRTDPNLASIDNPLGIDSTDPHSADDIFLINEMYLPAGRPVRLILRSRDVIHSFFVPQFRVKQDAVPGLNIQIWFRPNKAGNYEIACAEHCGLGHYRMRGFLYVLPPDEYQSMLQELPTWSEY